MKKITLFDPGKCVGCKQCALSCSFINEQSFSLGKARNKTLWVYKKNMFVPISCQHCEKPLCLDVCPTGAISRNENTGAKRRGIGKALIREGLSRLKNLNAKGCCLVGHPQYYSKFGFENVPGLVREGAPQEVFFALSFDGRFPQGNVMFHEGFKADGQQAHAGDAAAPCS